MTVAPTGSVTTNIISSAFLYDIKLLHNDPTSNSKVKAKAFFNIPKTKWWLLKAIANLFYLMQLGISFQDFFVSFHRKIYRFVHEYMRICDA